MKVIPLSEGAFTIDNTKQFIPFNPATDDLQQRAKGSLLVEIQPFAVITDKDIIVIDTGLGFGSEDKVMQIHRLLLDNGIGPGDVTKVLISHLHKDHAGGVSMEGSDGSRTLSFPNATYYVNKEEFEFGLTTGKPTSYHTGEFRLLKDSGKVVFTEGDGLVDDYIRYQVTGAHCPFHQVFWIKDGEDTIFFGGDVAPQLQQMKNRFVAKYDFDGKKAMQLRQEWWLKGEQEKWTFLFYHDIKTPVFSFK